MNTAAEECAPRLLGIDVGGTAVKIGLVRAGVVQSRIGIDADPAGGLRAALRRIATAADPLRAKSGGKIAAVGLAFPGIVDPQGKRILSSPAGKFDDACQIDVVEEAGRLFGMPVQLVNDANAALIGEWRHGAARGCTDAVMMTLGTGIGSSVLLGGAPLRGAHGQAGSLGGHFSGDIDGDPCPCGNIGCVETIACTLTLPRHARASELFASSLLSREAVIDYRAVFALARRGDLLATRLRDRALQAWGAAAVNLIHAYDPERLIIGGGILAAGEDLLGPLRAHVRRHAWTPWGRVEVLPAALGSDAGLLGAASLAGESLSKH
jgi:glucokinase